MNWMRCTSHTFLIDVCGELSIMTSLLSSYFTILPPPRSPSAYSYHLTILCTPYSALLSTSLTDHYSIPFYSFLFCFDPIRIVHDDGTGSTSLATLSLDPSGSSGVGYMAVGAKSGMFEEEEIFCALGPVSANLDGFYALLTRYALTRCTFCQTHTLTHSLPPFPSLSLSQTFLLCHSLSFSSFISIVLAPFHYFDFLLCYVMLCYVSSQRCGNSLQWRSEGEGERSSTRQVIAPLLISYRFAALRTGNCCCCYFCEGASSSCWLYIHKRHLISAILSFTPLLLLSAQSAVGPAVMKSVMNLVTPVTSISYHSSGEKWAEKELLFPLLLPFVSHRNVVLSDRVWIILLSVCNYQARNLSPQLIYSACVRWISCDGVIW